MSIGVAASPDRDWGFLFSFLAGVMIAGALLSVAGYMIGHVMGRLAAAMFGNRFWRVALTGDAISPGFYDLVVTLGKETVLRRVQPWIDRL